MLYRPAHPVQPRNLANATIIAKIDAIERRLGELKAEKKDIFDRLSQLSTLITGGLIAAIATIATIYYNYSQTRLNELQALDTFRKYLSENNSREDRRFGYFALTRLGQERLAIELITLKRDKAGKEVLMAIATSTTDKGTKAAALDGLTILSSNIPGCEALFVVADESGSIEFLNRWEAENIIEVDVPQLSRVPQGPANGKVRFNIRGAKALRDAWAEIEANGLLDRVTTWDGGYVPRTLRGPGRPRISVHACGLAFDINAAENRFGDPAKPSGQRGSVIDLVPIFEKHGFRWGGHSARLDPMHFEFKVNDNDDGNREAVKAQ